jgi:hypothetical protein
MTLQTRILMASAATGVAALMGMGTLASLAAAAVAPTVAVTVQNSSNANISSAAIGTSVHAVANIVPPSTGPTATGTVDYNLYSNQTCTGAPLTQSGVALVSGAASSSNTNVAAGGLSFKVHYNGNNDYSSADSACVSLSATQVSPSLGLSLSNTTITAGNYAYAIPNLTGETSTASGTIQYRVYSNNSCTTLALNAGDKTVTNGSTPNSESWQFVTPGTYYWQASYLGDLNNAAATSSCNASGTILTVVATSSTPTTTPIAGIISGTVFNDLNKDDVQNNGEAGLSGWTVKLHKESSTSTPWWKHILKKNNFYKEPVVATTTTDGNGHYSFGNLSAGTYFVEEIVMKGWKQTTDDTKVVLTTSHTGQVVNFADIQKATTTKHDKNNDKDKHDNDEASSTNHVSDNHNGWFQFSGTIDTLGSVFGWLHLSKK